MLTQFKNKKNHEKIIINDGKYENRYLITICDYFECLYYYDKFNTTDFIFDFKQYLSTKQPDLVKSFFKTINDLFFIYGCENEIDLFEKYGKEITMQWIKIAADKDYYFCTDEKQNGGYIIECITDDKLKEWRKEIDIEKKNLSFTKEELIILRRCVEYTVTSQEAWLSEKESITNKTFVSEMERQYEITKNLKENLEKQINSFN